MKSILIREVDHNQGPRNSGCHGCLGMVFKNCDIHRGLQTDDFQTDDLQTFILEFSNNSSDENSDIYKNW